MKNSHTTALVLGLKVRPPRRYDPPAYPRAGEPLDLPLSDPRTWPFSSTLAAILLAAAGSAGCELGPPNAGTLTEPAQPAAVLVQAEAPPAAAPHERPLTASPPVNTLDHEPLFTPSKAVQPPLGDPVEELPIENPFTFSKSQLPPASAFGKGSPSVLPAEVAVSAVTQVFAARGVQLAADVDYDHDGVAARLDGLNKDAAVGFEWLGYEYAADPDSLTPEEMTYLDEDMTAHNRHIAVINATDPRFITDSPIFDIYRTEEQALDELIEAVHQYVDFLEQEGVL